MSKKEFSHAYLYNIKDEQILVKVFKKNIYDKNTFVGESKTCEVVRTPKRLKINKEGRYCIHSVMVLDIMYSSKIHSLNHYNDRDICIVGKKGHLQLNIGQIGLTGLDTLDETEKLEVGDNLFGNFYDKCTVTKVVS